MSQDLDKNLKRASLGALALVFAVVVIGSAVLYAFLFA
jgi:hypothetical protein